MDVKNKLKEAIDNLDPSKYYNQNKKIYNDYFGEENLKNLPFKVIKIGYKSGYHLNTASYDLIKGTIFADNGIVSWDVKSVITETELKKIEEIIFDKLEQIRKKNERKIFENEK